MKCQAQDGEPMCSASALTAAAASPGKLSYVAAAKADELRIGTAATLTALDGVCWVTNKDTTWVARVPSIRIRRDDIADALMVVDGAARFAPHWCRDRTLGSDKPRGCPHRVDESLPSPLNCHLRILRWGESAP